MERAIVFYRGRMEGESSRQESAFLRRHIYSMWFQNWKQRSQKQHTSNRRVKQTEDFVFRTPSPPPLSPPFTYPCFKIRVGALLSEHDVLSSKSCSHLPRHVHRYTQHSHTHTHTHTLSHSLFHLSSSERRSLQGSVSPFWGNRFTHFEAHVFQPSRWPAPLSIISEITLQAVDSEKKNKKKHRHQ